MKPKFKNLPIFLLLFFLIFFRFACNTHKPEVIEEFKLVSPPSRTWWASHTWKDYVIYRCYGSVWNNTMETLNIRPAYLIEERNSHVIYLQPIGWMYREGETTDYILPNEKLEFVVEDSLEYKPFTIPQVRAWSYWVESDD